MFEDTNGPDQPFDFDELANHLLEQGLEASPSRLHGCLTGLLAGGAALEPELALSGLSDALDLNVHGELAEAVMRLYTVTASALIDDEFDFHLLLPDDEVEIDQRTDSLAAWCSGFLAGFALVSADTENGAKLSADSTEILKDIAQIAQAGVDSEAEEEESEESYFELVEYLRFASMNLYMDAQGQAEASGAPPALH